MSQPPPPGPTEPIGPPPGWYSDPGDPGRLRYWDGQGWTGHTVATQPQPSAWGTAQGGAAPTTPIPGYAGYGTYAPQSAPLTGSGMRRISELFNDAGRIIKRAWWPITAISLLVWFLWFAIMVVIGLMVVNVPQLQRAFDDLTAAWRQYPNGRVPASVNERIGQEFLDAVRVDSPVVWAVIGVVVALGFIFVACYQIAAVNRYAMDAAAGRSVRFGDGVRSGFSGGLRLSGYLILLTIAVTVAGVVWVAAIVLASGIPVLSGIIAVAGWLALVAVYIFVFGRLIPLPAQVVVARGALGWSWRASQDKFWAILGRYLLWAFVASVAANIVLSVLTFPIGLVFSAGAASSDPTGAMGWLGLLYLILLPLSMAVSALTMIGVVPIWRDLTDDPVYRSIDADGVPVRVVTD